MVVDESWLEGLSTTIIRIASKILALAEIHSADAVAHALSSQRCTVTLRSAMLSFPSWLPTKGATQLGQETDDSG
jgi:hypothetical protein